MIKSITIPPVVEAVLVDIVDTDRLNGEQRYLLIKAVLGYTLRVMDCKRDMKAMLEHFIPHKKVIRLGSNIKENYDLLVIVKNMIYRLLEIQETDRKEVRRRFHKHGLTREDADLYFMIHDLDLYEPAMKRLRTAKAEFLPPKKVEARCKDALATMCQRGWMKKMPVISRMFKFIYKYYPEHSQADVIQELLNKAAFVFYLEYPFETPLRMINKMKTSVKHNGINKLRQLTNKSGNARIFNAKKHPDDPDHFVVVESSIYGKDENGGERLRAETPFDLNPADIENNNVLRMSVSVLLKNNRGKKRKVLHLLMQHNRRDFVAYVSKRYGQPFKTVEDFYKHVEGDQRFLTAIRTYTRMPKREFRQFIRELRKDLAVVD